MKNYQGIELAGSQIHARTSIRWMTPDYMYRVTCSNVKNLNNQRFEIEKRHSGKWGDEYLSEAVYKTAEEVNEALGVVLMASSRKSPEPSRVPSKGTIADPLAGTVDYSVKYPVEIEPGQIDIPRKDL